jgi:hypothetical protein
MLNKGKNYLKRLCIADLLRQNSFRKNLQIRALASD